jgi:putative oxidoreductase
MLTHRLARPLIAGMFISGGVDAFLHPDRKLERAQAFTTPLSEALGLAKDTTALVRFNGAVQAGAGVLLAFGLLPRLAAASLATSLVPTTLAGHRFWEESEPTARASQRVQFLKNASMLGGLILAATDTDGRPSVSWRAKRAIHHASQAVDRATDRAAHAAHSLPGPLGQS